MSKVTLSGYILVPESDLTAVIEELEHHIALTRAEYGCLTFEVQPCEVHKFRFNVYEEFIDSASFECHQRRVSASLWGEVTRNADRQYTIIGLEG